MPEAAVTRAGAVPPEAQLLQMTMAQVVARLVHLAATLKLADSLAEGPKTAEELARLTATDTRSLYRVMRTLAGVGFFTEDANHRFSLQPLGEALESGTPGYAAAVIMGGEIISRSLDHLLHSVQTGETGFQKAFGMPVFEWLGGHPAEAVLFNDCMVGIHGSEPAAVAAAYNFAAFQTIVDVGGSTGNMLTTILGRHEGPRGILFDMPRVVRDAPALIAMNPDGRLLLVEMVLPEGDTPHPGKMLDMVMLNVAGGQERTPAEYGALLEKAGFRLTRVAPTASPASIVEAVRS